MIALCFAVALVGQPLQKDPLEYKKTESAGVDEIEVPVDLNDRGIEHLQALSLPGVTQNISNSQMINQQTTSQVAPQTVNPKPTTTTSTGTQTGS